MSAQLASNPPPAVNYGLTRTQYFVALLIQEWQSEFGQAPCLREIAHEMGFRSKTQAHQVLTALKTRGVVDWVPAHHRSLTLNRPVPWPPDFAEERPDLKILRLPEGVA